MSIILKSGSSGNLADVIPASSGFGLSVVVNGSIAAGSNLIGQVEISDGTNVLGTIAHPMIVSSAPTGDRIVTGNITASPEFVTISGQGAGAILFSVTGTWTGTLIFQASVDGTNWLTANVLPKFPGGVVTNNTTTNGQWTTSAGGLNSFRVGTTAPWTGTAVVTLEAGQALNAVEVYQSVATNLNVTSNIQASGTALTATGSSLDVNITGGGGNSAASATGSPVPADADYIGINVGGTLVGWTGVNPDGTVYAGQVDLASYNGTQLTGTITAYGTPPAGNVFGVNAYITNTVPVTLTSTTITGTVAVTQSTSPWVVSGTVTSNQGGAPWSQNLTEVGSAPISLGQDTMSGSVPVVIASDQTAIPISGTVAVTQNTSPWVVSGTVTANAGTGNFTVVQGTAASLNATVVGTGTFAVQASQSGNWTTRIVGNTGATLDAAPGAILPANAVLVGGSDGTDLRAIATDNNGQVKVLVQNTPAVTVSGSVSVTQGTSPWVVSLTSTTITGTVAVTQGTSPWVVSGTVIANAGSGTFNTEDSSDGTPGSAVPATALQIAGSDGVDLRTLSTSITGILNVTDNLPQIIGFVPDPSHSYPNGEIVSPQIDLQGNLITRGLILVDEGSFRYDFSGTSLTNTLTGTVNFTNNSTAVTGSGTHFTTELEIGYVIKKSADAETLYVVVLEITSDTVLTLSTPYQGTTAGSTAVAGLFATSTGSGGSITVSTSQVHISSGAASGSVTGVYAGRSDYLPLLVEFDLFVSQAEVNQNIVFGLQDTFGTAASAQVVVEFNGTNPAVGTLISSFSNAAGEMDTISFVFPNNSSFLAEHKYRIGISGNKVELSIDDYVVAVNTDHIPAPYAVMAPVIYIQNTGIPSSSTTVTSDFVYFSSVDRIQIDNQFDEPLPTSLSGPYRTNNVAVTVTPYNQLRVTEEATQLFYDSFDAALDTTNRWNVFSGNGGSNPTSGSIDNGSTSLVSGTTVNGYSLLQSQPVFPLTNPAYLKCLLSITVDGPPSTNCFRFWGLGITIATPTLTTPILDGVGYEIATDGQLYAVIYAGNAGTSTTRTQVAALDTPTDGNPHQYFLWFDGGATYWAIDQVENVVASVLTGADGPNTNNSLHNTVIAISNGTSGTLVVNATAVADTGHNSHQISDGLYPWRKATIKAPSTASVVGDSPLVVALHPSSPLPAGTNVLGTVTANAGTGTFNTLDAADMSGTIPGTAPSNTNITGGIYNSAAPTFSNGQTGPFQLDVNGNLRVVATGSSGGTSSNFGSVFPVTGTAIGAEYNVVPPTFVSGNMVPLQTDVNGVLKVNVSSVGGTFTSASNGPTGSPVPSDADFIGWKDGSGNLQGVSAAQPLPVVVTGTAAVTQSGNWTVRVVGNSGAVVDAAIGGAQPANALQVSGYVTTGNPTYSNNTVNTFSLTTVGSIRHDLTSVAGTAVTAVPSTFGSAPTGSVQGVNASLFAGTVSIPSGTFGTTPGATSGTLPVNASLFIGTTALTTTGTAGQALVGIVGHTGASLDGATGAAAPANTLQVGGSDGTNLRVIATDTTGQVKVLVENSPAVTVSGTVAVTQSTSPWVVSLTSTTITGTVAVTQSTSPWVVAGALTNNNAAPVATLIGVLPAIAETAYSTVTYTTGDLVLPVTDLHGALNQDLQAVAGVALGATAVTNFGSAPAAAAVPGVNASLFAGTTGITATGSSLNVDVTNIVPVTQSGTWTNRIVGNAGGTLDAAQNAAAPANELVVGGVFNSTAPAITSGNASQIQLDSTGAQQVNTEGKKATYRAIFRAFTPVASATSPMLLITGSATKTIRVTRLRYTSTAATGGVADIFIERFTTISGGTVNATATAGLLDGNNAAATATFKQYSTVPATATATGGPMSVERYETITASVSVPVPAVEWDFGDKNGQGLVLRGTGDFIGVMISAVGTTPVADVWIEWTEE